MPIPLLLHGIHGGSTVLYEPFGEWVAPWRFHSLDSEYHALRTGVGLIDYSTQALVEIRGRDRAGFLQRLLTNDVARLTPGTGCLACLVTDSAKLVAPLLVLADDEALWLLCDLPRAEIVTQTLNRYLFSEDVAITNHERSHGVLAFQGPKTIAWLTNHLGGLIALPNTGDHVVNTWHGVTLRLIRQTLTGEVGVLCVAPSEALRMIWEQCGRAGASSGLTPVGWEALNCARLEAGLPWWGLDMDETNLLPETGFETTAVSDSKGCYLGQEIIARLDTYGSVNKKLMGLLIDGTDVPVLDAVILRDGEDVGRVRSACSSPALRRPIALGYLERGAYEPGTAVVIRHGDARLPATVVARPFLSQE